MSKDIEINKFHNAVQIYKLFKSKQHPLEIWIKRVMWTGAISFIGIRFFFPRNEFLFCGLGILVTLIAEFLTSLWICRSMNITLSAAEYTINTVQQHIKKLDDISICLQKTDKEYNQFSVHAKTITSQTIHGLNKISDQAIDGLNKISNQINELDTQSIVEELRKITTNIELLTERILHLKEIMPSTKKGFWYNVISSFLSIGGEFISTTYLDNQIQIVNDSIKDLDKKINKIISFSNKESITGNSKLLSSVNEISKRLESLEQHIAYPPSDTK